MTKGIKNFYFFYAEIMSGFKAELERTGALEIVREVEGYVCYTRFLETAGEWTIS